MRERQGGFSMLEVVVVTAILGTMSTMVFQSMSGLARSQQFARDQGEAVMVAERLMSRVVTDVQFSMRVFPLTPDTSALVNYLDIRGMNPAPGSRFPVPTSLGYFEPDDLEIRTGNILLVSRRIAPALLPVTTGTGTVEARVDCYRFVAYYLSQRPDGLLDFNRWVSEPIARLEDIAAFEVAAEQFQVVTGLRAEGIEVAWDPDKELATAFRDLGETGALTALSGTGCIQADPVQTRYSLLSKRQLGVARNGSLESVEVPRFAKAGSGFPHGFEVKVDGNGAGRLVMVRLVLSTPKEAESHQNFADVTRLIPVKEL